MTAQIRELIYESADAAAWAALQKLVAAPSLLLDRAWVERQARLHARFVKLFEMQEAQR
jgi:hypothetical protein